ncbi:FAD-binding monooxygenase [bacterium CPR1]|nr:FAD-binding monooxygenase [bacterium CPR1]
MKTDVLICGAGPVGLMMAQELRRYGLTVRIVDQAREPSDKSRALVLWSRSLEVFARSDEQLVADALAIGLKAHASNIYADGKKLAHLSLDELPSPYRSALMIPQNETERLLTKCLERRGVSLERGTELLSFSQDEEGVSTVLRSPEGSEETVFSDWLIGCDGAHSTVRHALNVPFSGQAEASNWILADLIVHGALALNEIHVYLSPDGVLALFPIGREGHMRIIADCGTASGDQKPSDPTLEEAQFIAERRGPSGLKLSEPFWLAGFRIHERQVSEYRHGRVFLAGDAAHIHSPAGGQGMNTGLQDAFNLAWKLALVQQGKAREGLLDSYTLERHAVGQMVLKGAEAATRAATLRHPVAQYLRNKLAELLTGSELIQHRIARTLSELEINYRKSPLSREHKKDLTVFSPLAPGIRPGDRVPDGELVTRSGAELHLFDLLKGNGSHLLLFSGIDLSEQTEEWMSTIEREVKARWGDFISIIHIGPSGYHDREQLLHRAFGASSETLYWVRPDLYVGFRSQPADLRALIEYLGEVYQTTSNLAGR